MPSKLYQHRESAITWKDSGGSAAITLASLASGALRAGALVDLEAANAYRSPLFAWRAWVRFNAAPAVGEQVSVYLRTSDGTVPDHDEGTGDVAVTSGRERNMMALLPVNAIAASSTIIMARAGLIVLPQRWVAPVFFNRAGAALHATANECGFSLSPVPWEAQ